MTKKEQHDLDRYRWFSIVEVSSQGTKPEWWLKCNDARHGHDLPVLIAQLPTPMGLSPIMLAVELHERRYGVTS